MCPKVRTGLPHGWACRVLRQCCLPTEDSPAASLSCVIASRQWVPPLFQKLSTCFVHGGSYSAQPHYCPVNCMQFYQNINEETSIKGLREATAVNGVKVKFNIQSRCSMFLAWPLYAICLFKVLRGQMRRCMSVILRQMLKTNLKQEPNSWR